MTPILSQLLWPLCSRTPSPFWVEARVGLVVQAIFAAAAIVPALMAVVVWLAFRMARDEAAHPLTD